MQAFDYYKPTDFEAAFELLTTPGKVVMPLAGATDLIPKAREDIWTPDIVVDIKALPGMQDLKVETLNPDCQHAAKEGLYVGAAVLMDTLARDARMNAFAAILAQGAAAMGNQQVRNRATLGGNICTASPAADSAAALLVLEAHVLIKGPAGDRCVPVANFFVGPGKTALKTGELVVGVMIPKPPEGSIGHYEKLSRRKAGDLAIVGVGVLAVPHAAGYRWRIAMSAVAPTPIRTAPAEAILNAGWDDAHIEDAAQHAFQCCSPISDIRSSAAYRCAMVVNITRRAIKAVAAQLS